MREAILCIWVPYGDSSTPNTTPAIARVAIGMVSQGARTVSGNTTHSPPEALNPKLLPTTPVHVQYSPAAFVQVAVAVEPTVRQVTLLFVCGLGADVTPSAITRMRSFILKDDECCKDCK